MELEKLIIYLQTVSAINSERLLFRHHCHVLIVLVG